MPDLGWNTFADDKRMDNYIEQQRNFTNHALHVYIAWPVIKYAMVKNELNCF